MKPIPAIDIEHESCSMLHDNFHPFIH